MLQSLMSGGAQFQFGVAILGAGRSRRMGYPKMLLPWHGTSIIGFLLRQWHRLGARQVAVVCSPEDMALEMELDRLGFPERARIQVPGPEESMFHSVQTAARWRGWRKGLTQIVLTLGDQPHVRESTLGKLLAFTAAHSEKICQPARNSRARHPVVFPAGIFVRLGESQAHDLREFLSREAPAELCEVDDAGLEFDIDYPEDYRRARELAGCSGVIRPALLGRDMQFPDPEAADEEGLVAIGGDLSVPRLLLAYRNGIYPWSVDPITWWSPNPRGVFEMNGVHVSRSLERFLKHCTFEVTIDTAFAEVMRECARPGASRGGTTWISPEFIQAYTALHEAGHAHSVECWKEGRLVGGIYGVAIGAFFAGESMFHNESNASKVALVSLHRHLQSRGFKLFDVQMVTPATEAMGAISIPREEYLARLREATALETAWIG